MRGGKYGVLMASDLESESHILLKSVEVTTVRISGWLKTEAAERDFPGESCREGGV